MTTAITPETKEQPAAAAEAAPAHPIIDLAALPRWAHALGATPKADTEALILRAAKRANIATPEALAVFMPRMQARFAALRAAIGPDAPATHTFAHRFDNDYKTHVPAGSEHAMAMQDIQAIFLNRAADIEAALPLCGDPAEITALAARLKEDAPPLDTTLSAQKLEEITSALTADGKGGIDTPAHFKRNFLEHHRFHGALMDAFAPGSEVAAKLETSLAEALPQDDKAEVKAFLDDWLILRAERARGVMEATRPDGALAQSAVQAWAERQAQGQGAVAAPAASAASPLAAEQAETPKTQLGEARQLFEQLQQEAATAKPGTAAGR